MSLGIERQTFDRLVLEHLPSAQRFAIRLTGDPHAAEDLMQDALLKAHRNWESFRGESRFTTWLFRIIINCFRDKVARHAPSEQLGDSDELQDARTPQPAQSMQTRELQELIAHEVSTLPPRQREVLVLISYEQLSIPDVALVLNITQQNVRTTLHLARERLRLRLFPHFSHERRQT
jgi:RNA polymerase sigma-70 factor (ECF subfamily)